MKPLEDILSEIYPKFDIELKNSRVEIGSNINMNTGAIDYTHRPKLFDRTERDYLDGIIFKVPVELFKDPDLVRAYFAHECSHLELLKKSYHIGYFKALTIANKLTKPIQETIEGKGSIPKTRLGFAKMIINYASRLMAFVPFALYGNFVEKIVDQNAKSKGYKTEIIKLREEYPLKTFR